MKRTIIIFIFILMFIASPLIVNAEDSIKVSVDGNILNLKESPIIERGVTLVPFRPLFEALGYQIKWNKATMEIIGESADNKIHLTVNKNLNRS